MRTEIFLQKTSNIFTENRLLKFAMLVLGIATVINSFMVYRALKYQRTILIPPQMTGTVEFVRGKPTENYLKDIARRITSLGATYSPATARVQFEELLFYFTPESYPEESKAWYSLAGRIEESQVSSVFYLEKITLRKERIEVFGDLQQFTGDTRLLNISKTYIINYRLQDGRFFLLSLTEKENKQE